MEMGAAETLIVWEDLETMRFTVRNNSTEGHLEIFKSS